FENTFFLDSIDRVCPSCIYYSNNKIPYLFGIFDEIKQEQININELLEYNVRVCFNKCKNSIQCNNFIKKPGKYLVIKSNEIITNTNVSNYVYFNIGSLMIVNLSSNVSPDKSVQDQVNEFKEEAKSFDLTNFFKRNRKKFNNFFIPENFSSNIILAIIVTNEEKIYINEDFSKWQSICDLTNDLNPDELKSYMDCITPKDEDAIIRDLLFEK